MLEKHPNRKKDKYNPYTLTITEGHYYLSFKDGRGKQQNIEIDEMLYQTFDRFELEDISHLNRVSRHIEHSELTEETLNDRAFYKAERIEDIVSESIEYEQLHRAVSELPEVQRRRLKLYFFGFFFMAFQFTGQSAFTALGYSRQAIFFSLLRKAVIVAPLTMILPRLGMGVDGVFWAEPISNCIGGLACFITMYFVLYRKLKRENVQGTE